jgi:hypothetical protein
MWFTELAQPDRFIHYAVTSHPSRLREKQKLSELLFVFVILILGVTDSSRISQFFTLRSVRIALLFLACGRRRRWRPWMMPSTCACNNYITNCVDSEKAWFPAAHMKTERLTYPFFNLYNSYTVNITKLFMGVKKANE